MGITPGYEEMYGSAPDTGMPIDRILPNEIYAIAESQPYKFWLGYVQNKRIAFFSRDNYKFETVEHLAAACAQCVVWCEQHPLWAEQSRFADGSWVVRAEPRKRVLTLSRLLDFIRVDPKNWHYGIPKRGEDFAKLKKDIEQWIYHDKFEGVNAGFYNANIIAADIGLKTQASIELQGGDRPLRMETGGPISNEDLRKALEDRGLPTDLLSGYLGQEVAEGPKEPVQRSGDPEDLEAGEE